VEEAEAIEEAVEGADVAAEEIEAPAEAEEIAAAAAAAAEGETGNAESVNPPESAGSPETSDKE
jgi:hypothetical protein